MWRPFRHFDWSTISCGINGHATYLPDEPDLAARLGDDTPSGPAVRCLRCGQWVQGPPRGSGPADHAPVVLRGPALRDAVILRLLAVERFGKAWVMFALAYAVWTFRGQQFSLREKLDSLLPLLSPVADRLGVHLADTSLLHLVQSALALGQGTLMLVFAGLVGYGLLQATECLGLWLMKRWGEYVAAVATSVFIPLELYELVHHVTVLRVLALVINLAAVAYLVYSKRLFGLRGGKAAYEAQRHATSLLEVERAAVAGPRQRHR